MSIRTKIKCFFGFHDWRIYMHATRSGTLLVGAKCSERDCGRTRNFVEVPPEEQ